MGVLPDEIKPAMQGVLPSHVATCSLDGTPNTSVVSQVYYVDSDHVALSYQFFSKTIKNIRENPRALAWVTNPETMETWDLEIEYDHSETIALKKQISDFQYLLQLRFPATTFVGEFYRIRLFEIVCWQ